MPRTIIIGAAGAVGKRLTAALSRAGSEVIAADRSAVMPSTLMQIAKTCIGGVDVRDKDALGRLFKEHGGPNTTVWNLASPLSVDWHPPLEASCRRPCLYSVVAGLKKHETLIARLKSHAEKPSLPPLLLASTLAQLPLASVPSLRW